MRVHSEKVISDIRELRKAGYSINSIVKKFSIPKTTVWHHIHSIKLSPKFISRLKAAGGEGSHLRKEQALIKAQKEAKQLLESPDRYFYAIAASLYWAEGSKGRCEFINTDGDMIKLYLKILRNYFKIPENRIEPVLRIFSNHNETDCLNYWAGITSISRERFAVLINDGGTRGRSYGMCRIIVRKGGYLLKLLKAIINQIH